MGQATVPDAALRPQLRQFCCSRLLAQWGDPEFPSENLSLWLHFCQALIASGYHAFKEEEAQIP